MGEDKFTPSDFILQTLLLAGNYSSGSDSKFQVVANSELADFSISLVETANSLTVPIHRFIPILSKDTSLYRNLFENAELPEPEADWRNKLFFTIGGSEHNKLLELFIALHRSEGYETVLN